MVRRNELMNWPHIALAGPPAAGKSVVEAYLCRRGYKRWGGCMEPETALAPQAETRCVIGSIASLEETENLRRRGVAVVYVEALRQMRLERVQRAGRDEAEFWRRERRAYAPRWHGQPYVERQRDLAQVVVLNTRSRIMLEYRLDYLMSMLETGVYQYQQQIVGRYTDEERDGGLIDRLYVFSQQRTRAVFTICDTGLYL